MNAERLAQAGKCLADAVLDPESWPAIMDQICAAAGATGAALLQTDVRTPDIPRTASVDDCFNHYFANGWHTRDTRAQRSVPLLMRGRTVVTDQDIVAADEMLRLDFYNECALPFGLQWFAAIGFKAGPALWALVIQRSPHQGPFEPHETRMLAALAPSLGETATLSQAVGRAALAGVTNALHLVGQPALVLDRSGFVLDVNDDAENIFDDSIFIRHRRLALRDQKASAAFEAFLDQLRTTADTAPLPAAPIVVRRAARQPLVIRALPVAGPARTPFLGARALLVFSDLHGRAEPQPFVLAQTFDLTPAEAKLAALIAAGLSTEQAAERLSLSRATVRNQLKAVMVKTATHRQSELVALLSRF